MLRCLLYPLPLAVPNRPLDLSGRRSPRSLPISIVLWGLVQMALFWGEARGSLGKNLKEGCGRGFEAGERVVSTEGTMVTKFSPPGLPPGGETSASFKGRRTFRTVRQEALLTMASRHFLFLDHCLWRAQLCGCESLFLRVPSCDVCCFLPCSLLPIFPYYWGWNSGLHPPQVRAL